MTEKRRRGKRRDEPPVTSYRLSDDELAKYRDLKPPSREVRVRITARRTASKGRR